MLALLTHQFPELMVIFAKAVSIVSVMGLALVTHRLFENFELQYTGWRMCSMTTVLSLQYLFEDGAWTW